MAKKRLGIDALFASTVVPAAVGSGTNRLPLDEIVPAANQPRRYIDPEALKPLVDSIRKSGVLQPILVRELSQNIQSDIQSDNQQTAHYEIIAGERRWRAARLAGLTEIPVTIHALNNEEALAIALAENLQREDLNPVEETEGYLALLQLKLREFEEFAQFQRTGDQDPYGDVLRLLFAMNNQRAARQRDPEREEKFNNNVVIKLTPPVEETFAAIGRTSWLSFIQHRLPLRRLPADVLEALREGKLEYTKARLLGRLTGEALRVDERRAAALRARLLERTIKESLSLGVLKQVIAEETARWRGKEETTNQGWQQLARETARRLNKLRPEQLPAEYQQELANKLAELSQLLAKANMTEAATLEKSS